MTPPDTVKPTDHVVANRVSRHDEHVDIHIDDTVWQLSERVIKNIRDESAYEQHEDGDPMSKSKTLIVIGCGTAKKDEEIDPDTGRLKRYPAGELYTST